VEKIKYVDKPVYVDKVVERRVEVPVEVERRVEIPVPYEKIVLSPPIPLSPFRHPQLSRPSFTFSLFPGVNSLFLNPFPRARTVSPHVVPAPAGTFMRFLLPLPCVSVFALL
jgi:hypothetical protein